MLTTQQLLAKGQLGALLKQTKWGTHVSNVYEPPQIFTITAESTLSLWSKPVFISLLLGKKEVTLPPPIEGLE